MGFGNIGFEDANVELKDSECAFTHAFLTFLKLHSEFRTTSLGSLCTTLSSL